MFPPGIARPPDEEIRALAAQIRLPGGSAKNIVLDAAFRALSEAGSAAVTITVRHLVLSTAREYQKLGKPITKSDFGPTYYAILGNEFL